MKDIIQKRLETHYETNTADDELNALKEITQEVALYAFSKVGFFEKACFIGGTCLRIVHSLDRFSEDLDFSTKRVEQNFDLDEYLTRVMDVMSPYGFGLTVDDKDLGDRNVQTRFLKDDSIKKVLTFKHRQDERQKIKIKIEVDTSPPPGANHKVEYVDFPDDFQIKAYDLSSLMAGKLHALLCRSYPKGRDWYDFSWYIKNNCSPNLNLLENALNQQGPWKGKKLSITKELLKDQLIQKINSLDWHDLKLDVQKFLLAEKASALDLWNAEFFKSKVHKMKI